MSIQQRQACYWGTDRHHQQASYCHAVVPVMLRHGWRFVMTRSMMVQNLPLVVQNLPVAVQNLPPSCWQLGQEQQVHQGPGPRKAD